MMNAVPLSPLTFQGMVRRITADLHPHRSEAAMCVAVTTLGMVAEGKLTCEGAADQLRGLACLADPDGYAQAVRITLRADTDQLTEALAGCSEAAAEMAGAL